MKPESEILKNIPGKMIIRLAAIPIKILKAHRLGIEFYPENYIFFNWFNEQSVIIDVGCGHEAEFSKHLIKTHNLTAYGVDPTKRHTPFLKKIVETTNGKFHHLNIAVTCKSGFIPFHESRQNESGSTILNHRNVQKHDLSTYNVESVSLRELVKRVGAPRIDLIKLDLEGAEYELLNNINAEDINLFKQLFVEFHHHCTNYTIQDTLHVVRNICNKGFKVITLDRDNYLFYKNNDITD